MEGDTSLFTLIKNSLNENEDLKNNIFPMKSDYLEYIIREDYDEKQKISIKKVFDDYLIHSKKNYSQNHFYHCFQYEIEKNTGHDLILYFSVLVFYEKNFTIGMKLKELNNQDNKKDKKKDDTNIYLGKSIILISDKPIFSLIKKILERIYKDFISEKNIYINLETFISNIFNSLKNKIKNISFNIENEKNTLLYNPLSESILPFCDLNISYFFKIFDINDIFLFSEYYFLSKSIIIISPNVEILYPIYHLLMTFFFPLNFHSKYYFYKLLNPISALTGLFGIFPCFYFIYTDINKNNGFIEDKIINKITKEKKDILVYQIKRYFDKNKKLKFEIKKDIYLCDEKENISKISSEKKKNQTLIEKAIKKNSKYSIYFSTIASEINNIIKNKNIKYDFMDISINLKSYEELRHNFLALIIKFLVNQLEPLTFILNDNNKMEICPLVMDAESEKILKKIKEEKPIDEKIKDFLDSPQMEIIYKNEIIKFNVFDFNYLKIQILVDYFIKICQNTPNRIYFNDNNVVIKRAKDDEDEAFEKFLEKEIIFDDLFDYKTMLNESEKKNNSIQNKSSFLKKVLE